MYAKIMTNFATYSHSNNSIRRLTSKKEFFFFLKKHDLLHSTIERSERESYCAIRACDSAPEDWEILSVYSIFHSVLRNSQNSPENTCARVSFLIKLQDEAFFTKHLRATASQMIFTLWNSFMEQFTWIN